MPVKYTIANEIFARFPGYCRGVVLAYGISNGPSSPDLVDALREAEAGLAAQLTPEAVAAHPYIAAWREAYRSLGVKPSEFRPSMDALARRVAKKDPLPTISRVVDLGNLVSIQHLVPIGAHAIAHVTEDIALRFASGEESFEAFGSDVVEHPQPGEVIFAEGNTVLTRRWTWRQARHTLVVPETQAVEINVDGLLPVSRAQVEAICQQLVGLVPAYCGGQVWYEILSAENPSIDV